MLSRQTPAYEVTIPAHDMSDMEEERVTKIYVTRDSSHPFTALEEKFTNLD
jgi:hypothetical protein